MPSKSQDHSSEDEVSQMKGLRASKKLHHRINELRSAINLFASSHTESSGACVPVPA